jgi:NADP-dependent 3-hydroxy acid dehydrogenase YdfG
MTKVTRKIALVTGASSCIGEATAQRLATAGYKVYGTSRRRAESGRRSCEMLALDVKSDESVETVVSELMRREGRIDLLVNNAGFSVAPATGMHVAQSNLGIYRTANGQGRRCRSALSLYP